MPAIITNDHRITAADYFENDSRFYDVGQAVNGNANIT